MSIDFWSFVKPSEAVIFELSVREKQHERNEKSMKKAKLKVEELRPEYKLSDFKSKGIRGKYLKSYREGTNLVLLDTDVASAFPTDKSVNDALRVVMSAAAPIRRRTTRSARARVKATSTG